MSFDDLELDRYRSILSQMSDEMLMIEWLTVKYHVNTRKDKYVSIWKKMWDEIWKIAKQRGLDPEKYEKKLPGELRKCFSVE